MQAATSKCSQINSFSYLNRPFLWLSWMSYNRCDKLLSPVKVRKINSPMCTANRIKHIRFCTFVFIKVCVIKNRLYTILWYYTRGVCRKIVFSKNRVNYVRSFYIENNFTTSRLEKGELVSYEDITSCINLVDCGIFFFGSCKKKPFLSEENDDACTQSSR